MGEIKDYNILENLIKKWEHLFPENIFKNLEAAQRYENIELLKTYFTKFIRNKVENAEVTPGYERKKVLGLVQYIVEAIPEDCLDLIYAYLSIPLPENSVEEAHWNKYLSPTTDDYGPIIIKLLKMDYPRKEILELLCEINNKVAEGPYSNYKPNELFAYSVSPLENSSKKINETLDLFQVWIDEDDEQKSELIAHSLSELLSGTHHYLKYGLGKVTYGNKVLKGTPEVQLNRNRAIDLLKRMINHPSLSTKLLSIAVVEKIGYTPSSISETGIPLSRKIADERKQLIIELKPFVTSGTDFRLLHRIENLFIGHRLRLSFLLLLLFLDSIYSFLTQTIHL